MRILDFSAGQGSFYFQQFHGAEFFLYGLMLALFTDSFQVYCLHFYRISFPQLVRLNANDMAMKLLFAVHSLHKIWLARCFVC